MTDTPSIGVGAPELVELDQLHFAMIREVVSFDKIGQLFDRAYPAIYGHLARNGIAVVGAGVGISFGQPTDKIDLGVGAPVAAPFQETDEIKVFSVAPTRAIRVPLRGPYEQLPQAYAQARAWADEQGLACKEFAWEEYTTDPSTISDPSELLSLVYWPVRD